MLSRSGFAVGLAVVSVVLLAAGAALAQSHSATADGSEINVTPGPIPVVPAGGMPVNDGSFENGGQCGPGTSAWAETDSTGCSPWVGDWFPGSCIAEIFPNDALDGEQVYWAGGFCGNQNVNTATQSVTVDSCSLSFWYATSFNGDDDGVYFVSVEGTDVWTLQNLVANDNMLTYEQVVVDVCAMAGVNVGDAVTLQFGVRDPTVNGGPAGNVLFDVVEWAAPVPTVPYPVLALLAVIILAAGVLVVRRLV